MGKYLQSTGGIYRNDVREDWELAKVSKLLAHNNAAERPFAVAKAYLDCFPTMKLSTLANYSLALTNGSRLSILYIAAVTLTSFITYSDACQKETATPSRKPCTYCT
jgi:hypothetical protein